MVARCRGIQEGYVVEGRLYLDDTFFFLVFLGEEISKPKVTKEGKKYTASSVFFGFFGGGGHARPSSVFTHTCLVDLSCIAFSMPRVVAVALSPFRFFLTFYKQMLNFVHVIHTLASKAQRRLVYI